MKDVLRGVGLSLLLALLVSPVMILVAQDDEDATDVTGARRVTDVLSAMNAASEAEAAVNIQNTGSDDGFEAFCQGEADVMAATRPISVDEETLCNDNGITFNEYLIGHDVLVLVTHPDMDYVQCLDTQQLTTIFAPSATDQITDWAQTGVSIRRNAELSAVLPEQDTATHFLLDREVDGFGLRSDAIRTGTDSETLETVRSTPGAIGAVKLSALGDDPGVHVVEINNAELGECFTPSVETAENDQYPLADELLLYVNPDQLAEDAGFNDLLTFATGEDAVPVLADTNLTAPSGRAYERNQEVLSGEREAGRQFSRELVAFEIPNNVSGSISMGGAASLYRYVQRITNDFRGTYSQVSFNLNYEGEPAGLRRFCGGELDMITTRGELTDEARANCQNNTVEPFNIDLGHRAVVLLRHDDEGSNLPDCLAQSEILTIWRSTVTEGPTNWQSVNEDYPDVPLTLVAPEPGSSDYTAIMMSAGEGPVQPIRTDVAEKNNDAAYRAAAVANAPGGLTFVGWQEYQSILEDGQQNVQPLAVNDGQACITPSQETITDGSYPLSEPADLIVKTSALTRQEVQSVLWYMFQDENYPAYEANGLVGVTFGDFADVRDRLQDAFEAAQTEATEATPEAAPTGAPDIGPDLPFDLTAPEATAEPEAPESEDTPEVEATPEATEDAS